MTPEELRVLADPAEAAMVHSVGGAPAVIGTGMFERFVDQNAESFDDLSL